VTKHITRMEIDDAEHYTPEQGQAIIDSYPEHEREARTKGIPFLGSGRVFPISENAILIDPLPIPMHWYQIVGIDFGWEHPFAATRNVWDKDNDIWYVVASYREAKATPPIHVGASGYRVHGRMTAWMVSEHATHEAVASASSRASPRCLSACRQAASRSLGGSRGISATGARMGSSSRKGMT
jgi:Terminase large subunit, T4likevirus-type, N-terminal